MDKKQYAIIRATIERAAREREEMPLEEAVTICHETSNFRLMVWDEDRAELRWRDLGATTKVTIGKHLWYRITSSDEVFEIQWSKAHDCFVGFQSDLLTVHRKGKEMYARLCNDLLDRATQLQLELDKTWERYDIALDQLTSWAAMEKGTH